MLQMQRELDRQRAEEDESNSIHSSIRMLKHEMVLWRIEEIGEDESKKPKEVWYTRQNGRALMFEPLVNGSGTKMPPQDKLGLSYLRENHDQPAPLGAKGKFFTESRVLIHHATSGKRTLPRSRTSSKVETEAKKARLAEAKTSGALRQLLKTRAREIRNSNVEGTEANIISKFLKWRHFCLENGYNPIRWSLQYFQGDAELLARESELFMDFIAWGSLLWGSHEVLAQAVSAVKTVHRKLANVLLPPMPAVTAFLGEARKRMHMESNGKETRDEMENFEMNDIMDQAMRTVSEYEKIGGTAPTPLSLKRKVVFELSMLFAAATVRELGVRPGEVLCGDKAFNSHWGGAAGKQLHWTKAILQLIASMKDGTTGLIVPPMGKTWFRLGPAEKSRMKQKKAIVALPGDHGKRGMVFYARRLMEADPLQPGEVAEDEPICRDPKHLGGTGKSHDSEDFNTWTQEHWIVVKIGEDWRVIKGYSWKYSAGNAMANVPGEVAGMDGVAQVAGMEARQFFFDHHSQRMVLTYDAQCAVDMARIATQARGAVFRPIAAAGPDTAAGLQAVSFKEAMVGGWHPDGLQAASRSATCLEEAQAATVVATEAMKHVVDLAEGSPEQVELPAALCTPPGAESPAEKMAKVFVPDSDEEGATVHDEDVARGMSENLATISPALHAVITESNAAASAGAKDGAKESEKGSHASTLNETKASASKGVPSASSLFPCA